MEVEQKNNNLNLLRPSRSVNVGGVQIGGNDFVVIAGPCSIESYDQFKNTAQSVFASGAQLLRGGIWKVRTNAESFQGLGDDAFSVIRQVLKETGLSLVSEVTDASQIEEVDDLVSMYQVGSRNMHNTALLKELGRTRKPILLKRGFAALIDEWLKASEYIRKYGNENIVLCERGIRTFETATRNTLDLNAVAYVKHRTDLPVIVDPSHAVGIAELVPSVALAAAAVGADGLIIEVHPEPAKALSDGMQALSLGAFDHLMNRLRGLLPVLGRPLHPQVTERLEPLAH